MNEQLLEDFYEDYIYGTFCPFLSLHLDDVGGTDWADMQKENFSEWQHKDSIKQENKICSATGDSLVPFASAKDIAVVAFHALTDDTA